MPTAPPPYLVTARRWLLYGVIAGVPLLFLTSTYEAFSSPKFVLLVIAVSAAAGVRAAEYVLGARDLGLMRRLAIPAGAVALPLTIGWLASPYKGLTFIGELGRHQGLFSYLLFIVAGVLILETFRGDPWRLARMFVYVGTGVAIYALMQKMGIDPIDWAKYASGSTLGNPNFVGGYLAMTLAPSLYLLTTQEENRGVWIATTLITVGGIVVVGTVGGWVAAAGGAAVVLAWRYGRSGKEKVAGLVLAGLMILGSVGMVVATIVDVGVPIPDEQAVEIRGEWWQAGLNMAVDAPLVGRGPGAFAIEGIQHRPESDALRRGDDFADDPHSVLIWYLTSAGLLGGAGFVLLLAWIVRTGMAVYRGKGDPIAIAFFAAAVAYSSQALVSIDELGLRSGLWVALAGLAIGTDFQPSERVVKPPKRNKRARRRGAAIPAGAATLAIVAAAVPTIAGLVFGFRFMQGDLALSRGATASSAGNFDEARTELARSVDLLGLYEVRFLQGTLLGHLAEVAPSEEIENELDAAFAYLDDVPHIRGMSTYAKALAKIGREDEALDWLDRAANSTLSTRRSWPTQATILLELGRTDEAVALLEPLEAKAGPRTHAVNQALEVLQGISGS